MSSAPPKPKERTNRTTNGRKNSSKKRLSDGTRSQGPRSFSQQQDVVADATQNGKGDFHRSYSGSNSENNDQQKTRLAEKIINLVYNQEPEDPENKLMDVVTLLVEENAVAEVEMLREEVQNLKKMLHDATGLLQHMHGSSSPGVMQRSFGVQADAASPAKSETVTVDWDRKLQQELQRQKRRFQEEYKRDMDKLRQYFEKQCSQGQTDYVNEIYALKLECQEVEQQRAELVQLRDYSEERDELVKQLEEENESIMREKVRCEREASQLHVTLMKMEKDKLASEERTKKILSAVREGLHRLSDMKDGEVPGADAEPGLSTFYNHVEEIITTDDWNDDDLYVKGVMEEIQVSVQKLSRPARAPESVIFEPRHKLPVASMESQTDFPSTTAASEIDAIKSGYESRISTLQESLMGEKRLLEQSVNDYSQQVLRLSQKSQADKRFIEELSSERDTDREEMTKLTQNLEESWRECEQLQEKITISRQAVEYTEKQLRELTAQNETVEASRKQAEENMQAKDELLRQRDAVVAELELQLSEKLRQESDHQSQLERLKMELSGFLRSPPLSPTPGADMSFTFDDLRRQIMDLRDELEAQNRLNEAERDQRVHVLQEELDRVRKLEERVTHDRGVLERQISSQNMEIAVLRENLDQAKFGMSDDSIVHQLNSRIAYLQRELEDCQRVIENQDFNCQQSRVELDALRKMFEEKQTEIEQLRGGQTSALRDEMLKQMEHFESRNKSLVEQMEETAQIWDEQQKAWEDDLHKNAAEISSLRKQLSESRETVADYQQVKVELHETLKRFEQTESIAREKTVQVQSLKNLMDIVKTEAGQKDAAMKALQKQFNDNSSNITRQLEELEKSNQILREEVDVYRNASSRSVNVFEPLLREKDAEITHLRDLLEASFDESMRVPQIESSIQTELDTVEVPKAEECVQASGRESEVPQIPGHDDVEIQVELLDVEFQDLLAQLTDCKATVRELEHAILQKDNQMEAMAVELASLSDRHGKTQTKYRSTIRYLNQSGNSSSSEEESVRSMPKANFNGEAKQLIEKYEGKLREMEQVHNEEIHRLVQESLTVLHNQSVQVSSVMIDSSTRDLTPASIKSFSSNDDSTLNEAPLSDTLQRALRELRNGSEAVLKASTQLNGAAPAAGAENWPPERDLMLAKVDFFRETISQLVLSRDSMEMALRHMEQQNDELKSELEMLKKEDEMADQGKDLLLSLLKKTEAELAELHSRYRQRDLRLEIEQAGREREEHEREKLQKELRDSEVQLVRLRGELRQKEAQWERERILTMWKKDSTSNGGMEDSDISRSSWKGKYLRAESYRKNLTHQKRYLISLIDDIIINTTDEFVKQLAIDGIRPASIRGPTATVSGEDRRLRSFRSAAVAVCAITRLRLTKNKWQQVRNQIH